MGYYYIDREQKLRIVVIILAIAVVILGVLALRNCSRNDGPVSPPWWETYYSEDDEQEEQDVEEPETLEVQEASLSDELEHVMDQPLTLFVDEGESYEDCFLRYYPELGKLKEKGLGGAKLLGETCADAHRDYKSKSVRERTCRWPRPEDMGIGLEDSDEGLPNRVNNEDVDVEVSPIDNQGGISGWYSIFGLFITIENMTSMEMDVVIRQGLLLETIGNDVQNIVIRKTVTVHLSAYEKQTVRVTAYCASHHRTSPVGYTPRITPFYLMAEESVFYSQESVWQWQEEWYESMTNINEYNN